MSTTSLRALAAIPRIIIRCSRCERTGVYSYVGLANWFGADAPMPIVLEALIGDCPKRDAIVTERCSPFCPELRLVT